MPIISRGRAILFQVATTASIFRLSTLVAAQQTSSDVKQADKIRGAVLGSLLADSLALGR